MARSLVTGASGFVGPYLVAHLQAAGDEVVGAELEADITDAPRLESAVAEAAPEVVYHLAALSHVGTSWDAPAQVFRVNVVGTLNLLLAAERAGARRVLVIGSAEQYGVVPAELMPIREDVPQRPVTPYGASKAAAEMAASFAHRGRGLEVVCVRAFNHLGPGQSPSLVASTIAQQIALNERDEGDEVRTGDLSPKRDFSDVRDVVRAYRLLAQQGVPGEAYNVCSGRPAAVSDVADLLLARAKRPMRLVLDRERLRPVDVPVHWGDNTKLRDTTGWEPEIPLEQSLADVLDWWREQLG